MQRRDFFKNAGMLAATGLTVSLGSQALAEGPQDFNTVTFEGKTGNPKPGWGDAQVEHFTSYYPDFADKILWIRKDNQVVAAYRNTPHQKYPYIYPLAGPISRASVTAESAQPWPHHRSVFILRTASTAQITGRGSDHGQIFLAPALTRRKPDRRVSGVCIWKNRRVRYRGCQTRKNTWKNPLLHARQRLLYEVAGP